MTQFIPRSRTIAAALVVFSGCAISLCALSRETPPTHIGVAVGGSSNLPSARLTITSDDSGAPLVQLGGAALVRCTWVSWLSDWRFVSPRVSTAEARTDGMRVAVDVSEMALHVQSEATLRSNGATFDYDAVAQRPTDSVIGMGVACELAGDAHALGGATFALEDAAQGPRAIIHTGRGDVVLRFVGFAGVAREQYSGAIRALIVKDRVTTERRRASIEVSLPSDGRSVPPRLSLFDRADPMTWPGTVQSPDDVGIDLSSLNEKPAGLHGRVRAVGENLVFADGTKTRFWGTNVQAYALFNGTDAAIRAAAHQIAAAGFNLVRIHHHDSRWVTPNLIDASDGRSQRLDERSLERLDFWTKALKDEGVYLWIDLHVGRRFLSGDDIPGFSELERAQEGEGKGFTFLNPRIGELMDAFSRAYLTHRNRYSGTTLATDPAVAAVLLTNENDLVEHFGNLFLGDKHNDAHRALFESEAQSFAAQNHLDRDRLEETWKPGPAKLLLASLEKRFFDARTRALRDLGYAGLVSFGSTWGGNSEIGLLSLSGGDVVDVHSYGGVDELRRDPRVEDDSLAWIGAAQVAGKPLTITEWNVPLADDRFTAPLRMAATASLQGWDAPMLYGWLQHPPGDTHGLSAWSAWSDPAIASLMPAAAVLFREAHVPESTDAVVFRPSQANLVDTTLSPRTSATLRTFYESRKLSIALPAIASLPWLAGTARNAGSNAATIVTDPQADGTATPARGPIRRDAERGVLVVDTPRSAVVSGFIGGQRLALQDVTAQIDTAAATVALTSLDGLPLATSQRILVSFVARVVGEGPDHDRPPLHAEPVRGTVLLTTASHLSLVLLDVHGARRPARQLLRRGAQLVVPLPADGASHWALLVP